MDTVRDKTAQEITDAGTKSAYFIVFERILLIKTWILPCQHIKSKSMLYSTKARNIQ